MEILLTDDAYGPAYYEYHLYEIFVDRNELHRKISFYK